MDGGRGALCAALLVVVLRVLGAAGDVESTLGRCCVLGANWAREDEACAQFPSPVAGEPSEHQSICLTAAAICCLRYYREKQCEAGKAAAQKGQDCRLPAAEGGEYYKDCCEGCKLGLVSGSMSLSCSFRSLQFGFPWDSAYTHCCSQMHPDLPLLPLVDQDQTRDNSVLYPGSQSIADSENLCLLFPGQLCAHVCVPVPGSYSCQCRAGFTLSVDKKTCLQDQQADRCAQNEACEHICRDTGVAIECACDPGYRLLDDQRSCADIDECAELSDNCDRGSQFCINTQGGFVCQEQRDTPGSCPAGYKYSEDNSACGDVNECEERRDSCSPSSQTCINSVGSYRCIDRTPTCPFGYRYDSGTRDCLDINECLEGRDFCDVLTERCTNLPGGYRCEQLKLPRATAATALPSQSITASTDPYDDTRELPSEPLDTASHNKPLPPFSPLVPNNASETNVHSKLPSIFVPPSPPTLPPRPDFSKGSSSTSHSTPVTTNLTTTGTTASLTYSTTATELSRTHDPITTTKQPSEETRPSDNSLSNGSSIPASFGTSTLLPTFASPTLVRCPPGFVYDAQIKTCTDTDECLSSPCNPEQRCRNTLGSFECHCREGYREDSSTGACRDVNECQMGTYNCDNSQRCDNTVGSYTCVRIAGCGTGYTLNHNNGLCEDNDECESGMHDCDQLGPRWFCVNNKGSFRCEKKKCPELEFLDDLGSCVNITCPEGYKPDKKSCVDIDECSESGSSPCRSNENCINLLGSHTCQPKLLCGRGYRMDDDGTSCIDIDECATNVHECSGGQMCNNRQGTYTCQCPSGYRLNHLRKCQDVDECTSFYGSACSSNAACENTPGSFQCNCHEGFTKTDGGRNCVDVDECSSDPNVCHHRCINVRGGYQCICNAGYSIAPDNRTCLDVDECEQTRERGRLCVGVCQNTPGSFQCVCPSGYSLAPDQRTCKDLNECDRATTCRNPDDQCINTRGGHRCMEITCPQDYVRDTSHKSRCKKRSLYCRRGDLQCAQQPLSYSYNFLPLVSNMTLPSTGQVDLFTMRGPLWSTATVHFSLDLESVNSPEGRRPASREYFRLRRTSVNQAVISLVARLEGPQEVQLALSMQLYHDKVYSGSAVAKLLIIVSQYNF